MTRLRPWAFALIFFILINIGIEGYFSIHGDAVYVESQLTKRATYYTENEIRKLLRMMEADPAPKVIVLGDSFLWGTGVAPNDLATEKLKVKLANEYPEHHIWNVALPASHAADVYAMLKTILPMKPNAIILNTNYYFFSIPENRNHMTQKWMLPALVDEPEYDDLLTALEIRSFESGIQAFLRRILPIYKHKVEINLTLFGHTTGQDFITAQIARVYSALRKYSPIALPAGKRTEKSHREFYDPHIVTEEQINVIYAKKIADLLDTSGVPAYVFSTPQNPNELGSLIQNDIFAANMAMIDRIYAGRSFLYENLHGRMDPSYQMDNIHLTPAGHDVLADLLYDRLRALLLEHEGGAAR